MFEPKKLFLIKIVLLDKKDDTYRELASEELHQPVTVNKGDFFDPRGFTLEFGFDLLKVEEVIHSIYDRESQIFHSVTLFVTRVDRNNNPISRWTYQFESNGK